MKYIIANWKMNPQFSREAKTLFDAVKKTAARIKKKNLEIVVCAPFVYLEILSNANSQLSKVKLGGQNCFWEQRGAFTGEISPQMLKDAGCEYVILGHSERRRHLLETDEAVNKKIKAALENGLKAVLCVGETERIGEFDLEAEVVGSQLERGLEGISRAKIKDVIIAYEPVWAIGTGVSDTPNQTLQAAIFIRKKIGEIFGRPAGNSQKILYGGSVTAKNVRPFVEQDGIDGVLVGGASLKADEFSRIVEEMAGLN